MEVAVGAIHVNTTGTAQSTVTMLINGDIDPATADHLRVTLVDVIMRRKPGRLVVDLDGVTALDSATIGTLHAAHATAEEFNLPLTFRTSRSPVYLQLDRDGIHHNCD